MGWQRWPLLGMVELLLGVAPPLQRAGLEVRGEGAPVGVEVGVEGGKALVAAVLLEPLVAEVEGEVHEEGEGQHFEKRDANSLHKNMNDE